MSSTRTILLLAAALLLSGCPKPVTTPVEPSGSAMPSSDSDRSGSQGVTTPSVSGSAMSPEERRRQQQQELLRQTVIYFDFDESRIRPEFMDTIAAHASYLAADRSRSVRLEGHADERGTREYNIGLGERRAQAVRQALVLGGATSSQITTVSYGEERPAVRGSNEQAYARNRRVEIVYTSR